ncbi:MAG: SMC-Scp complex subunit ScpB [Candidatus Bathyarchaeia archaeon]
MRTSREPRRLAVLEAALYAAGRPVGIESLKQAVRTRSDRVVRKLVRELAERYEARGSALEVKELPGDRIVLKLRPKFNAMVRMFTRKPLLTRGPLKTLSYIAYHQPVEQTKVIVDRGNHVYGHLRMMEEMGLIVRERTEGGGVIIKTTPYFADYFGFSQNLKSKLQLRQIFSQMKITKLDNGDENGGSKRSTVLRVPEILPEMEEGLAEGITEYSGAANQDA